MADLRGRQDLLIDACDQCGETHYPLTYYKRTREYLCEPCLIVRKREVTAKRKVKRADEETEIFRELISLPDRD